MSNLDDFAAHETDSADVDAGGSGEGQSHFSIGDGPPGLDSLETESDGPSGEASEGAEVKPNAAVAPPAEFFSFRTADGTTKTFRSADEAQQFFGSWNGRLSKAEKELRDATQANFEWQRAYESGELFQTFSGKQAPAKPEPTAPVKEDGILNKVDWKYVTELLQKGQSDKALQYLSYANGEYLKSQVEGIRKEFQGQIENLTAPARFQNEVSEALNYVVESAFAAVDDMGQPLFPEFHEGTYDGNFVKHFRDIWFNQDVNLAVDPNLTGLRAAYFEAKATYRPAPRTTAAPPAPSRTAPLPPRAPDGTFTKRNAALAMSGPEGPGQAPAGAPQSREAAILEGMRNAGKSRSKHFAIDPD